MKANKNPPSPELVREASVAADILALWAAGDRKQLSTDITSGGDTSDGFSDASEMAFCRRIVNHAVGEFLRNHPDRRSPRGEPYQTRPGQYREPGNDEWEICCLFCGHDINTYVKARNPPPRFWETIQKHTWLCAAQYLAGMTTEAIDDRKPARSERVVGVAKLHGRQLFREAKRAAEYLGLPVPRCYRGKRRTPVTLQRQMVTAARATAKARSIGTPDDQIPALVAVKAWREAA